MYAIRETTKGRLVLYFTQVARDTGPGVVISKVDEMGWARELGVWSEERDERELGAMLADVTDLPDDVADAFVQESLAQWTTRARDADVPTRLVLFGWPLLMAAIVIVAVALLVIQVF